MKLKPLVVINKRKTLPCRLHEFQAYTNFVFQPFDKGDDDYGSTDSSPTSPRDSLFSQVEVESSDTILMPVMVTEAIDLGKELANIKVALEDSLRRM